MNKLIKKSILVFSLIACTLFVPIIFFITMHNNRERIAGDETCSRAVISSAGPYDVILNVGRSIISNTMEQVHNKCLDKSKIDIPPIIMKLKPRQIFVYKDQMHIHIASPGNRTYFVIFNKGSEEFGMSMVTNGLWYLNYNEAITNGTQEAFDRWVDGSYNSEIPLFPEYIRY